MRYIHVINKRQRGVPIYLRTRATKLCGLLNSDASSPWYGTIIMPGEKRRPHHLMRQHGLVSSLDPVVRDSFVKRLTDEEAGRGLLNYWGAARQRWQSAFEEPQR